MKSAKRTFVYVDGFNLFHALDEFGRPHLKWLNLRALSESLLRPGDQLVRVNYYTAYATWMDQACAVHRDYVKALRHVGVNVVFGKFKRKYVTCKKCYRQFTAMEEKRTDVNIAMDLVVDGLLDKYDRAILISADTDLVATVERARELKPGKEIFVAVPPGRMRRAREFGKRFLLGPVRLGQSLLAAEYTDADGAVIVRRPPKYDPPD